MNEILIAQFFHVLAVVIWIGGIFMLDLMLAPLLGRFIAAQDQRVHLLYGLLRRFFAWVWLAGGTLVVTGYGMVFLYGGFGALSPPMWIMVVLGTCMVLLALHVFFAPFRQMGRAIRREDWKAAAGAAAKVRFLSGINLFLAFPTILAGVWGIFGSS
ncbi:MAG: CopD family protein [Acidithiobacillus sp.]|uniref:CopD family protein n=1 Tax=Acidithiobacillus sp. TaxID=1872118 RepID=UPI003D094D6F